MGEVEVRELVVGDLGLWELSMGKLAVSGFGVG